MTSLSFQDFFTRVCQATDIENQSHLAQVLGVGRAAISLAKQKDSIPWKWVFALAEAYNLNSNWLATGTGQPAASQDPSPGSWTRVPHALAVPDRDGDRVKLEITAPRLALPLPEDDAHTPLHLVSLEMTGPCMEPEIKDRDLLVLDQSQQIIHPGLIYALDLAGTLLVRRIDRQQAGAMTLICDNPAFPPAVLAPDQAREVAILGRVVRVIRHLGPYPAPGSTALSQTANHVSSDLPQGEEADHSDPN
ncbi:LexA family transcriptional regulator [Desulfovermiculus halophilus]|jgi:hypothetical protein|uniref:LexA family transcriptional regulator n=1 Tax=Desulfovermiculus halophilus TaxID=339722 RepID=UPI000485646D|nr:LexA family transcriptional regulator [Desulfovermiculus halophilus]